MSSDSKQDSSPVTLDYVVRRAGLSGAIAIIETALQIMRDDPRNIPLSDIALDALARLEQEVMR